MLQALAEKEATLAKEEEAGQRNAVRVLVQGAVVQALKEDSKAQSQVTLNSVHSNTLKMQPKPTAVRRQCTPCAHLLYPCKAPII